MDHRSHLFALVSDCVLEFSIPVVFFGTHARVVFSFGHAGLFFLWLGRDTCDCENYLQVIICRLLTKSLSWSTHTVKSGTFFIKFVCKNVPLMRCSTSISWWRVVASSRCFSSFGTAQKKCEREKTTLVFRRQTKAKRIHVQFLSVHDQHQIELCCRSTCVRVPFPFWNICPLRKLRMSEEGTHPQPSTTFPFLSLQCGCTHKECSISSFRLMCKFLSFAVFGATRFTLQNT